MANQTDMRGKIHRWVVGIGLSLWLCAAPALLPGPTPAWAEKGEQSEIIEALCAQLGEIAWAAFLAGDYTLLAQVDAAMEAIGCFD